MRRRCGWARDPLDVQHHDEEWGVPEHDDRRLFEFLVLEGAQAGLSWLTILRKRDAYCRAFADFDPEKVARFSASDVRRLLGNDGIVRNRAKIEAAIGNARACCAVRREYGSFARYAWRFVGNTPIQNAWRSLSEVPSETDVSRALSRDLVKRGFRFVGPTICYAFMQSVGMVNDHVVEVRDVATGQCVTIVELLSPVNKLLGHGRQAYVEKRTQILRTRTGLVEVDLLRAGDPMPVVGEIVHSDYRILVSRGARRPRALLFAWGLRQLIPTFELPLLEGDQEPTVDLAAVVHALYDRARFDLASRLRAAARAAPQ